MALIWSLTARFGWSLAVLNISTRCQEWYSLESQTLPSLKLLTLPSKVVSSYGSQVMESGSHVHGANESVPSRVIASYVVQKGLDEHIDRYPESRDEKASQDLDVPENPIEVQSHHNPLSLLKYTRCDLDG